MTQLERKKSIVTPEKTEPNGNSQDHLQLMYFKALQ